LETNWVREYRQRAGLTQVELARKACIAESNLSAIECGRLKPWPKAKRAIVRALKVRIEEVFPGE